MPEQAEDSLSYQSFEGIYDSHIFLIYYCGRSGDMVLTERQNDIVVYKRIHGVMPRTSHK